MRNYYAAIGLNRTSTSTQINDTLDTIAPEQLSDEGDMTQILRNEQRRKHYDRLHLQYEAIAAVLGDAANPIEQNAHSWDRRVVEFTPENDTIEMGS